MNSPELLLRLVQALAPASVVFVCERFFTAPLRALSPVGLLMAIGPLIDVIVGDNAGGSPKFLMRRGCGRA